MTPVPLWKMNECCKTGERAECSKSGSKVSTGIKTKKMKNFKLKVKLKPTLNHERKGIMDEKSTTMNQILQSVAQEYCLKPDVNGHPSEKEQKRQNRKRKRETKDVPKKKKRRHESKDHHSALHRRKSDIERELREENPQKAAHSGKYFSVTKSPYVENTAKIILHRMEGGKPKKRKRRKKRGEEEKNKKRTNQDTSMRRRRTRSVLAERNRASHVENEVLHNGADNKGENLHEIMLPPSPVLVLSPGTEKYLNELCPKSDSIKNCQDQRKLQTNVHADPPGHCSRITNEPLSGAGIVDSNPTGNGSATNGSDEPRPAKATTSKLVPSENSQTALIITDIRSVTAEAVATLTSPLAGDSDGCNASEQCASNAPTKQLLPKRLVFGGDCIGLITDFSASSNASEKGNSSQSSQTIWSSSLNSLKVKPKDNLNRMKQKGVKLKIKLNCKHKDDKARFRDTLPKIKGCILVTKHQKQTGQHKFEQRSDSAPNNTISRDDTPSVKQFEKASLKPAPEDTGDTTEIASGTHPRETETWVTDTITKTGASELNCDIEHGASDSERKSADYQVLSDTISPDDATAQNAETAASETDDAGTSTSYHGIKGATSSYGESDLRPEAQPETLPKAFVVLSDICPSLTPRQKLQLNAPLSVPPPDSVQNLRDNDDDTISLSSDSSFTSPYLRPPSPLQMDGCLSYLFSDLYDCGDAGSGIEQTTTALPTSSTCETVPEKVYNHKGTSSGEPTIKLISVTRADATSSAFKDAGDSRVQDPGKVVRATSAGTLADGTDPLTVTMVAAATVFEDAAISHVQDSGEAVRATCNETLADGAGCSAATTVEATPSVFENAGDSGIQNSAKALHFARDETHTDGADCSAPNPHPLPSIATGTPLLENLISPSKVVLTDIKHKSNNCKKQGSESSVYNKKLRDARRNKTVEREFTQTNGDKDTGKNGQKFKKYRSFKHVALKNLDFYSEIVITVESLPRKKKGEKCLRSEYNYLGVAALRDLTRALSQCKSDDRCKAVLLSSVGPIFSSGLNPISLLDWNSSVGQIHDIVFLVKRLVDLLITFRKPLVAAVQGPAVGFAATMLLFCDAVYASERANFHWPHAKLGLCPFGCVSCLLPQAVGRATAHSLLLGGRVLSSSEAKAHGLVNEVFPHDSFMSNVLAHFREWCNPPASVLWETKQLLTCHNKGQLHDVNKKESELFRKILESGSNQTILESHIVENLFMH